MGTRRAEWWTAYFMAMLMRAPYIRVIGVDTEIAGDIEDTADDLRSERLLTSGDGSNIGHFMADYIQYISYVVY
jgi:hypothetical protein